MNELIAALVSLSNDIGNGQPFVATIVLATSHDGEASLA